MVERRAASTFRNYQSTIKHTQTRGPAFNINSFLVLLVLQYFDLSILTVSIDIPSKMVLAVSADHVWAAIVFDDVGTTTWTGLMVELV